MVKGKEEKVNLMILNLNVVFPTFVFNKTIFSPQIDVIILATGFLVQDFFDPMQITGKVYYIYI